MNLDDHYNRLRNIGNINQSSNLDDHYDRLRNMGRSTPRPPTTSKREVKIPTARKLEEKSFLGDIGGAVKGAWQSINPFDDVSMEEATKEWLETPKSEAFQEVARGSNRTVDSASLGLMSNLDKKVNDRDPYYLSQRKFGEGGATDFITSGLGYLVPGVGAYRALGATSVGRGLTNFGSQGIRQRLASEAGKGAITGFGLSSAEVGVREGLNPDDYNWKQNALHVGLGTGLGAVADPLLYGAGKGAQNVLSRFAKGDVPTYTGQPSANTLDSLRPQQTTPVTNSNALYDRLASLRNPEIRGEVPPTQRDFYATQNRLNQLEPQVNAYQKEFQEAVEQQYQYLKNSMGRGVEPGNVIRDQTGEVVSRYGRISNNPGWYQEFYRVNGRKPTNPELRELAEQHVREGFTDEVGQVPAWTPSRAQEIDEEIFNVQQMLEESPDQIEALNPILRALEQEKDDVLSASNNMLREYSSLQSQADQLRPSLDRLRNPNQPSLNRLRPEFEAITPNGNQGEIVRAQLTIDRTPVRIENPKEIVKRQIDVDGKREKSKWSFDKFMTAAVDDLRPLDKATRQLGGKDLPLDQNPYTQARLSRGVAGKAETYLKGGIYNEQGQKVGKSLQEIIKPIEKKMDDFRAYIVSKRAIDYDTRKEKLFQEYDEQMDRYYRGEINKKPKKPPELKAGIKPKDVEGFNDRQLADATIKQLEHLHPSFKQTHQELVQYSNHLLDELVNAGVLTREAVDSLRTDNPNYIPMFRVQEPKVRGFEPLTNPKRTYANLGEPLKTRTGSEKPIVNPIESLVKNTYLTLNMAERNKVGHSLLELVEGVGDNTWGRVVKSDKGLSVDEVSRTLDEANAQLNDGQSEAIDNLFKGEGNKVYVYRDGKRVEMELQEDLYKAMLTLDTQKQNFFIKMLSVPTRMLRTGAVLSPDFGPVNIFRDQFSAFVNSKYGFVPFFDMFSGLTNVLKKDDLYWQWKNSGGANSVLSSLDREYLQADLRKMVKQSLWENTKDKAKHPLRTLLEPLRKVSEVTEEATRLGEFKKGIKKGATPREAAFASRDLIDFNRAGNLGRQYNQVTAFFNAAVQSMDKTVRTFREQPIKATLRALSAITLPSLVAYMYNHDKEWYQEIPQREKDLYWHFEVDGQIYKLPKPFEVGVIFGTTAERIAEFLKTNDPEAFEGLGDTVRTTFTPPWLPTAIAPWIEVYANRSTYFDSPIVPRREEGLLPEDQFGPYQSELFKGLGQLTNTSPRLGEHVFKGYTGGLGKYFLQGTDYVAELSGVEKPELPDRGLADLPIINRFVVKNLEGNNQSVDDFYTRLDQLRRENLSAKKNDIENPDNPIYRAFNRYSGNIGDLQAKKRQIIEDMKMTGEEKAKAIKEIDKEITRLAKEANSLGR